MVSPASAGAYASRAGLNVALFEQSDKIGGYFRSFKRDGFHFDTGLKAIENAGMLIPLLKQLGLESKVRLRKSDSGFALPDRLIPLKTVEDIRSFYRQLGAQFPHDCQGLEILLRDADRISAWVNFLVNLPNPLFETYGNLMRRFPSWLRDNWRAILHSRRQGS